MNIVEVFISLMKTLRNDCVNADIPMLAAIIKTALSNIVNFGKNALVNA